MITILKINFAQKLNTTLKIKMTPKIRRCILLGYQYPHQYPFSPTLIKLRPFLDKYTLAAHSALLHLCIQFFKYEAITEWFCLSMPWKWQGLFQDVSWNLVYSSKIPCFMDVYHSNNIFTMLKPGNTAPELWQFLVQDHYFYWCLYHAMLPQPSILPRLKYYIL